MTDKKTIVILGRSRSGTSMVAGMCAKLGVDMRETNNDPVIHNPRGAFENVDFVNFTIGLDGGLFKETIPALKAEIEERDSESDVWGFKSALTHKFIDHFMPYLVNPHFIYVFRNPLNIGISESFIKGSGNDINLVSESIVQTGEDLKILGQCIRRYKRIPHLYLSFEDIRLNPLNNALALADFLDIHGDELASKISNVTDSVLSDYCSADEYKKLDVLS